MARISGGGGITRLQTTIPRAALPPRPRYVPPPPVERAPLPPRPAYIPPSLPTSRPETTETGARIEALAASTGVPPAVWYSMFQQTNFSPTPDEAAQLAQLHSEGYDITQIDPRTGSITFDEPPVAPAMVGDGGLPPSAPPSEDGYKMFEWDEGGYELAGGAAPDWWQAFVPKEVTPETAYGAMLNAMIPFISPEDQVRVAHSLYNMFDTEMSHYKPGYIPEVSTVTEDQARYLMSQGRPVSGIWEGSQQKRLATGETITTRTSELEPLSDQMRRYFMSSKRATDAIETLSNMREAMVQGNRWKLGPGYKWLQNIMGSVAGRGASGETAQTRQQYLSMLGAVDPFLSQAGGGELQAFGPLGQMLTKPFFTAGQMMPQQQGRFGAPNRRFF